MAEKRHYPRAPITEAVIEIRFDDPMSARDMERVTDTSHWPSRKRRLSDIPAGRMNVRSRAHRTAAALALRWAAIRAAPRSTIVLTGINHHLAASDFFL